MSLRKHPFGRVCRPPPGRGAGRRPSPRGQSFVSTRGGGLPPGRPPAADEFHRSQSAPRADPPSVRRLPRVDAEVVRHRSDQHEERQDQESAQQPSPPSTVAAHPGADSLGTGSLGGELPLWGAERTFALPAPHFRLRTCRPSPRLIEKGPAEPADGTRLPATVTACLEPLAQALQCAPFPPSPSSPVELAMPPVRSCATTPEGLRRAGRVQVARRGEPPQGGGRTSSGHLSPRPSVGIAGRAGACFIGRCRPAASAK